MAEVNNKELETIIGDKKVFSPFNDILVTDIVGMGAKEHDAYVNMVKKQTKGKDILSIAVLKADDGYVDVHYVVKSNSKFERIRRITGYLVGTVDRWNNSKAAELKDRVKHA